MTRRLCVFTNGRASHEQLFVNPDDVGQQGTFVVA